MKKKDKAPQIRFKGYTDDWEQRKLGEFGKATGGTSIESEFSEDGIYKVISIGSYSEHSTYNDQGIRAIESEKTKKCVLNKNDLTMILNDKTTSGNIIGRVLLIDKSGVYVYNQRTERIEIDMKKYDPIFLYEMLNAPNIRDKIIKQAQGNTQIYVNWSAISLLDYMVPLRPEQVQIGRCLHCLSNLITLHQRKYDKLVNIKKSMLEKMFPKRGAKVLEIRFKGYTDDWEQRKLGDTNTFFTDGNYGEAYPKPSDMTDSSEGIPFLTGGNLKSGKLDITDASYITKEKHKKLTSGHLVEDDIVIAVRGSLGALGYVNKENSGWNINSQLAILRTDKTEISGKYLLQFFLSDIGQVELVKRQTGSALKQLPINAIKDVDIPIPSIKEQTKIGEYFYYLDHLITLHQRKLEKLRNIKKACLEKMFV